MRAAAVAGTAEVAFVFGTEANGLGVEEVRLCNLAAMIPCNPAYTSLNLAAAVQIFAYEFRQAVLGGELPVQAATELARHEDIERLHSHLENVLAGIGFFDPANPKRLLPRLRRLVARACLEAEEVRILRGALRAVEVLQRSKSASREGLKDPSKSVGSP